MIRIKAFSLALCLSAGSAVALSATHAQATPRICKDGTTTTATGRGTCSGHGGVGKAATKATRKEAKAEIKAAKAITHTAAGTKVTVTCTDGSKSNSTGRGSCSGHGGVMMAGATSKTTNAPVLVPSTATPPANSRRSAPLPRASARARERANENSRVAGSGSADDNNPSGAVAQCKDGMYSHAQHSRGSCGHHGGVARWM